MLNWYVVSCDENNTLQDMTKTRGKAQRIMGCFILRVFGGFPDDHKTDLRRIGAKGQGVREGIRRASGRGRC
jgi:hypothetical protein